jgi:GT2 family glycosyltransferase
MRHLGFRVGDNIPAGAVWLLNPDTEVVGNAAQQLIGHLERHPEIGAVGPRLEYGDGRFQHGAFAFPGFAQLLIDLFGAPARVQASRLNGRYDLTLWDGSLPFPVDMLLGAAMMVRGETIAQVGLMDEGYFMYAEELDWCRQIIEAGWGIEVVPAARVLHHSGQSTRQFRDEMFIALWCSRLRYYQKWESSRYVRMVRLLLRAGMAWQRWKARGDRSEEGGRRRLAFEQVAQL